MTTQLSSSNQTLILSADEVPVLVLVAVEVEECWWFIGGGLREEEYACEAEDCPRWWFG